MGAPLDREACLRYQEVLTHAIFNGYGTTEAFWNTFLRPCGPPRACGLGGPRLHRRRRRRGAHLRGPRRRPGRPRREGRHEVGEVVVRSVKSGYAYVNQPEEQAARFRDGWLYIGDLATWDADEYVTIVGRKDDMIISGGENVHPTQVEGVLNEHPGDRRLRGGRRAGRALGRAGRGLRRAGRPGARRRRLRGPLPRAPDAGRLQATARLPLRRRAADDRHRQEGPLLRCASVRSGMPKPVCSSSPRESRTGPGRTARRMVAADRGPSPSSSPARSTAATRAQPLLPPTIDECGGKLDDTALARASAFSVVNQSATGHFCVRPFGHAAEPDRDLDFVPRDRGRRTLAARRPRSPRTWALERSGWAVLRSFRRCDRYWTAAPS